ncbi:site-specific DNA-methyltransferase [Roseiflexus castenholzii]|uniref:Methyltransferase n=1 Tax=Roseiflexus castenholzii (strain DSM 13941 / HLO8) TaxID=383372 RepID=A7NPZ6_ROSCS|nr:site-specific DNA-methyltransferase [Roseiflexus castenholzii]ABU59642.1 DNA methylase N-4/N-6 domain protein [Roseiflexus castenholzii DSM 13941]
MARPLLPNRSPAERAIPDDVLRLARTRFTHALARLRESASIAELRTALDALWREIDDPSGALLVAADDAETTAFSKRRLRDAFEQIARAYTLERARYYLDRLARAAGESRTGAINEIDLNRWKEYDDVLTDSLWLFDRRAAGGAHHAGFWGNFVPQIPYQLMLRYTRRGDLVLDPFAGSGTTLIEAQRLGRLAIGVELNPAVAQQTRATLARESDVRSALCALEVGDSAAFDWRATLERYGVRSAQLAILHPPYHDIIRFSDDPRDLANAPSVDAFLSRLGAVVAQVKAALDAGRYLALVLGDKYANGEWVPLGFLGMQEVLRHGFTLKSIVVKNFEQTTGKRGQHELWRYRALVGGFYVFKHEYIFIFRNA